MPITPKHAFKEKSIKLLILLPLRTIYNRTFQCETPCIKHFIRVPPLDKEIFKWIKKVFYPWKHSLIFCMVVIGTHINSKM
jgi:hypothetical protein